MSYNLQIHSPFWCFAQPHGLAQYRTAAVSAQQTHGLVHVKAQRIRTLIGGNAVDSDL